MVTVAPIDLATRYGSGEQELVADALARAAAGNLDVVLRAFRSEALDWVDADGPTMAGHRRLVIAAVALETSAAGLDSQWTNSRALIEWACSMLRTAGPPRRGEREWALASVALIQGARDMDALRSHLTHLQARFPDEPRWRLASAFEAETAFWDARPTDGPVSDARQTRAAESALTPALADPMTADEAHLRLGYLALHAGRLDDARERLRATPADAEPTLRYLWHLFRGWAEERGGRRVEAAADFRAALDAVPGGHAATLALASLELATARPQDARRAAAAALQANSAATDPWRLYGYGDYRRWPEVVSALRKATR